MKVKRIAALSVFCMCASLSACAILDSHKTYIVKDAEYKNQRDRKIDRIGFGVANKTEQYGGFSVLAMEDRWIHKGPYDVVVYMNSSGMKRVTFNKILLHQKKQSVDIRERMTLRGKFPLHIGGTYYFNEGDKARFKDSGVIDFILIKKALIQQNAGDRSYSDVTDASIVHNSMDLALVYENSGIVYRKDKYFTVEADVTFEWESGRIDNKVIKVEFKRKTITEYKTIGELLGLLLLGLVFSWR